MYKLEKAQAKQVVGGLSFWTFSAGLIMIVNALTGVAHAVNDIFQSTTANANGSDDDNENKNNSYRSKSNYFNTARFKLGLTPGSSSYSFPVFS
ncbi:MPN313 family protein [Mycoplasmoides genitalium]|uniref:Uncharacterized protein MG220 n=2 Tax=Mycoplasmoides genitalium TaxID=2097 RepID=Y220_MYCGE|nr:hypothetical protein [Mycoplasmoides genitalium]Q49403.2 RecName: Full=Uncharacterized protein MG220 [Mycoplasmoides genitalium G37]ABY79540.1 conserved hypothetical protein [synthetic Mycoplasma genitalium JCVI-1.0]AAC71441.2 conserved hypothetical protein [Mycoplasmoides genitalium G37]AFQ03053.1 hypothetical protein CM9_01300 [Mycoplasmoides genitalium M2321]AFQ04042.1 hypothetical protein CM1_01315 [Mycoplasmoides genitalium M6320]AFQ04542.1 hypothetical protein CM5_01295 [Mycoplasmoid